MTASRSDTSAPRKPPEKDLPVEGYFPSIRSGAGKAILIGVVILTLAALIPVAMRSWKIGIAGQWQWEYFKEPMPPLPWLNALPCLVLGLFFALLTGFMLRRGFLLGKAEAAAVAGLLAISGGFVSLMAGLSPLDRNDVLPSLVVPWAGGYYAEALKVEDMGEYLDNYDEIISELRLDDPVRGHIANHPAGPVVFHWLVNRAMTRRPSLARHFEPVAERFPDTEEADARGLAQVIIKRPVSTEEFAGVRAAAVIFWIGFWLMLPLAWLLARDLYGPRAGLVALGLAAMIPSAYVFGPYPDQLFPLFLMAALYTWHRSQSGRHWIWASISGAVAVIGLMWSMALLVGIALIGIYAGLAFWRELAARRMRYERWLKMAAAWVAGFLLCALPPMALFGYDTFEVWRICLTKHASFAAHFSRSYWPWTLFNPIEFALFAGIAVAALLVVLCGVDVARILRKKNMPALLPWALVGTLLLLDLSGKNLGEVGRLWMFLMPVAAVSVSGAVVDLDDNRGCPSGILIALAAVQAVVFRMSVNGFAI